MARQEGEKALLRLLHLHAPLAFGLRTSAFAPQLSNIRKPLSASAKTNRGKHYNDKTLFSREKAGSLWGARSLPGTP